MSIFFVKFIGVKEGKLRGSLTTLSQSPILTGLISEPGPATGLFKRRNAFWKVDNNRAGSVPDVPETKKLMAFPTNVNDSSSLSSNNQHVTKNFNSTNKSKLSVHTELVSLFWLRPCALSVVFIGTFYPWIKRLYPWEK